MPRVLAEPQAILDPKARKDFAVVAIGASAGGLDACKRLLMVIPPDTGMAFVLVQHLDPTHESMIPDLLAGHTSMKVQQAEDGMLVQPRHLYVIPPGSFLSVGQGALHLSQPQARHGARLPFDFLLHSLAEAYGPLAIGIVLSGTGSDGSLGMKDIKAKGGFLIVQDPGEASYNGMPESAIATGLADRILPLAEMGRALVEFDSGRTDASSNKITVSSDSRETVLKQIIDLLRTKTGSDFTLYKQGTLQRRIERRMVMVPIEHDDMGKYLDLLKSDADELASLSTDLLINVTSFFRDPKVFDLLEKKIIPELIRTHPADQPLRIWVAGCSTGEETYSLAMLFREQLAAAESNLTLQVFASDVDREVINHARDGLYPQTIEKTVSATRLAKFFSREDQNYRVLPALRGTIVFTEQNVLADPPFSRLDFISCRNLLIYLRPDAQAKVVALFHFALREGGLLLLGNSETIASADGRFEVVSRPERLYRHIGRGRQSEFGFSVRGSMGMGLAVRPGPGKLPSRQAILADFCRGLVMDGYAPAAVLSNARQEFLFSLGPTDRYLHVAPGHPTSDLLAMARQGVRAKLRAAFHRVGEEKARVIIAGGQVSHAGHPISFNIDIQPVVSETEELLLICFVEQPHKEKGRSNGSPGDRPRIAELEQELDATKIELQAAIRTLEVSGEEQKAINEEALSVNEEYQSTNEELVTSKEELQSLNEELTALNSQLQETLERQRTTSNDLKNVLYSTDLATIFLDIDLNIRFFTPATRSLFSVIPGDIGRPLADLNLLATDSDLLTDAHTILKTHSPIEREIMAQNGSCYLRRILPYRTADDGVEGIVITFADITERKRIADALEAANRQSELANIAKSRFLAVASHDLRQPLQTLALLQGLLLKTAEGLPAQKLLRRLDETLASMSGMLNTLLDINQIEAGTVHADVTTFAIDDLFDGLREEFAYHAQAKELELTVVSSSLWVRSDPRLLEQMLRNLLSNALKYTRRGKILLGCRRHGDVVCIEIWDTGIGIRKDELQAIFEEYHQLDNPARESSRGLGLGLSIVHRLGTLLDHQVQVRSRVGRGSGFMIDVPLAKEDAIAQPKRAVLTSPPASRAVSHNGMILIIEDDPELRDLLGLVLSDQGYQTVSASDGLGAIKLVSDDRMHPDLILADFNLPHGMTGVEVATRIREKLDQQVPVIILSGDTSDGAVRNTDLQNSVHIKKPVGAAELTEVIQLFLPSTLPGVPSRLPAERPPKDSKQPIIFVIDDDNSVRAAICSVLEDEGHQVEDFSTCEAFLDRYKTDCDACLLVDASLPGMTGLELLRELRRSDKKLPVIMITGYGEIQMAVEAMKAGASDFIEKPIGHADLIASIDRALEQSRDASKLSAWRQSATDQIASLTTRERQVMDMVLAGHPNKNIAADLGISQRTVENHRAAVMKKTGVKSIPALARLALAADRNNSPPSGDTIAAQ